ncbi:hypothetical protein POM88_029494 [Heracleum sosnowskyi]|uniref:Leucine-rich repeat domain, L domain-containing protein n=1 Tax=Heracleum sosnowskyi TaxID=360622 RepID=A0AAD8HUV0_9APIA|nr:hypothetical protein POM88_029494 [Heracleum sosnowskyi]
MKAIKYVSVVNRVLLLLHNGAILKFALMFTGDCDAQVIHEFIDHWIPLLSRNGTKKLILEENNDRGEFKPHNFSSLDLTHLRLTRALFPHKLAFGGFRNLINLELVNATSNFGQSILDCPALEKLTLIFCYGIFPINFHVPNLRSLHLVGQKESSNVVKVLGGLQKIEKFSTGWNFLKYLAAGGCPSRLSQPLPYLKTLNIWEMNFVDLSEISCLLCLIWSAPNLSKLHISASHLHFKSFCISTVSVSIKRIVSVPVKRN